MTKLRYLLPASLAAALLLIGCTSAGTGEAPTSALATVIPPAAQNDTGDESSDSSDSADDQGSSGAGQGTDYPVLDSAEWPLHRSDNPSDTFTVNLHSLTLDGEYLLLHLSFTPHVSDDSEFSIFDMNARAVLEPLLSDVTNFKAYSPISETSSARQAWATSTTNSDPKAGDGQTLMYWAYFAAPVDDVQSLDLAVTGAGLQFENVQITGG